VPPEQEPGTQQAAGDDAGGFELDEPPPETRRPTKIEQQLAQTEIEMDLGAAAHGTAGIAAKQAEVVSHAASGKAEADAIGVDDGDAPNICPRCKRPVELGKTICGNCGFNLETDSLLDTGKRRIPWIPIAAGVVLLVGAVVAAVIFWPKKEEPKVAKPPVKAENPPDKGGKGSPGEFFKNRLNKAKAEAAARAGGSGAPGTSPAPGSKIPLAGKPAVTPQVVTNLGGKPLGELPPQSEIENKCAELVTAYREQYKAAAVRNEAKSWSDLGEWCSKNGMRRESQWAFQRATELDPSNEKAQQALGKTEKIGPTRVTKAQAEFLQGLMPVVCLINTDSSLGEIEAEIGGNKLILIPGKVYRFSVKSEPQKLIVAKGGKKPVQSVFTLQPLPAQVLNIEILGPMTAATMDLAAYAELRRLLLELQYRNRGSKGTWTTGPATAQGQQLTLQSSGMPSANFVISPKGDLVNLEWGVCAFESVGETLPSVDTKKNQFVGRLVLGPGLALVGTDEKPVRMASKSSRLLSGTVEKGDQKIEFIASETPEGDFINCSAYYRISEGVEKIVDAEVMHIFGQAELPASAKTTARIASAATSASPSAPASAATGGGTGAVLDTSDEEKSGFGLRIGSGAGRRGPSISKRPSISGSGSFLTPLSKTALEEKADRLHATVQAQALYMEAMGMILKSDQAEAWVEEQLAAIKETNTKEVTLLSFIEMPLARRLHWMPVLTGAKVAEMIEARKTAEAAKEKEAEKAKQAAAAGGGGVAITPEDEEDERSARRGRFFSKLSAGRTAGSNSPTALQVVVKDTLAETDEELKSDIKTVPEPEIAPDALLESPEFVHLAWRSYSAAIRDLAAEAGNRAAAMLLEKIEMAEKQETRAGSPAAGGLKLAGAIGNTAAAAAASSSDLMAEDQRMLVMALVCADAGGAKHLRNIALKVEDPQLKARIIAALVRTAPDEAVNAVKIVLPGILGDQQLCSSLMRTLGKIASPEAISILKSKTESLDPVTKITSISVLLATLNPEENEGYIKSVAAMSTDEQLLVIDEISRCGGTGAILGLEQLAIQISDPTIRGRIALRLAQIGGTFAANALGKLMEVTVVLYDFALAHLPSEESVPLLRTLAGIMMSNGQDAPAAAIWLGLLGRDNATGYLKAAADAGSTPAICALMMQGTPNSLKLAGEYVPKLGPGVVTIAACFWQSPQALTPLPASVPWEWNPEQDSASRKAIAQLLQSVTEKSEDVWSQLEATEILTRMGYTPPENVLIKLAESWNMPDPITGLTTRTPPEQGFAGRLLEICLQPQVRNKIPKVIEIVKVLAEVDVEIAVRERAIAYLGKHQDEESAALLVTLFQTKSGTYDTPDALEKEAKVRAAAARALGDIQEAETFQALYDILISPMIATPGGAAAPTPAPPGSRSSTTMSPIQSEALVRAAICEAFGKLGEPKAIDLLDEIARGKADTSRIPAGAAGETIRSAAILALAKFRNAPAVQSIKSVYDSGFAAKDPDFWQRVCATMSKRLSPENAQVLGLILQGMNEQYAVPIINTIMETTPKESRALFPALAQAIMTGRRASDEVTSLAIALAALSGDRGALGDLKVTPESAPQVAFAMLQFGSKEEAVNYLSQQIVEQTKARDIGGPQTIVPPRSMMPVFVDFVSLYATVIIDRKTATIPISAWRAKYGTDRITELAASPPAPPAGKNRRMAIAVLRKAGTAKSKEVLRQLLISEPTEAAYFAGRALGSMGDDQFLRTGIGTDPSGSKVGSAALARQGQVSLPRLACIHGIATLPEVDKATQCLFEEVLKTATLTDVAALTTFEEAVWIIRSRPTNFVGPEGPAYETYIEENEEDKQPGKEK